MSKVVHSLWQALNLSQLKPVHSLWQVWRLYLTSFEYNITWHELEIFFIYYFRLLNWIAQPNFRYLVFFFCFKNLNESEIAILKNTFSLSFPKISKWWPQHVQHIKNFQVMQIECCWIIFQYLWKLNII